MIDAGLDLMAALVLESGARWGTMAADFQWDAARHLLLPSDRPFRWDQRPRGGSKTTDAAGWCIAWLLQTMPEGSRLYAFASDRDQARLLLDALAGFVLRTPELHGAIEVGAWRAAAPRRGSVLEVLAADAASAYGLKPAAVVADEVCQYPTTPNAQQMWEAVISSLGKVPGARLAAITTPGSPSHWTRRIYDGACSSARWAVAETPGPLAWVDPAFLDEQRRLLPASSFARLHLGQWATAETQLASREALLECVTLDGPQSAKPGRRYVCGVDLGIKKDRTVAAVCHVETLAPLAESGTASAPVTLDRMAVFQGSRDRPVDLGEVEAWLLEAHREFRMQIVIDPYQAVGMAARLRAQGVPVTEFNFSQQSVGRLALAMLNAIRNRGLALPDDPDLIDELSAVQLREVSPGVFRMDHSSSGHDDRALALSLAVQDLLSTPTSSAAFYMESLRLKHGLPDLHAEDGGLARPGSSGVVCPSCGAPNVALHEAQRANARQFGGGATLPVEVRTCGACGAVDTRW